MTKMHAMSNRTCLDLGRVSLAALLVIVLMPQPAHAAEVYKWTDAEGNVHFGDKAPPDAQAQTVKTRTETADQNTVERLHKMQDDADKNFEKRKEGEAAELEKQQEADKIAAHCEASRKSLEELKTSARRQFINDKGEREYLGEERRQEWIKTAEDEVAKYCR